MIKNLDVKINNVQFVNTRNESKIHIHFRGVDSNNQININGYVPVSNEEYEANAGVEELQN